MRLTPTSCARTATRALLALSCAALLSTNACHREPLRPLTADDPLPVLRATPIAPIRDAELFNRLGDEYLSRRKELELQEFDGKDEAGAIAAARDWLRREFGAATEAIDLVLIPFASFSSKSGGTLALRQQYRGIDTQGTAMFESGSGSSLPMAFVNLYELSPTNDPPARVIPATEASDRANQMLSETPNAMSTRREGDRPELQYVFVAGQSSRDAAGRLDGSARWDLIWGFRLPSETFSREPFVNARTGEATVGVCGTGEPDPVVPIEGK